MPPSLARPKGWLGFLGQQTYFTKEELKMSFDVFDADGNGKLSKKEIEAILGRSNNGKPAMLNKDQIGEIVTAFDKNGDGFLDIDEFAEAMASMDGDETDEFLVRTAFKIIDKNKSGKIEKSELIKVLVVKDDSDSATPAEVAELIKAFDVKKDGKLSLAEFGAACETMSDEEATWLLARLKELVDASKTKK